MFYRMVLFKICQNSKITPAIESFLSKVAGRCFPVAVFGGCEALGQKPPRSPCLKLLFFKLILLKFWCLKAKLCIFLLFLFKVDWLVVSVWRFFRWKRIISQIIKHVKHALYVDELYRKYANLHRLHNGKKCLLYAKKRAWNVFFFRGNHIEIQNTVNSYVFLWYHWNLQLLIETCWFLSFLNFKFFVLSCWAPEKVFHMTPSEGFSCILVPATCKSVS